ncbi:MAG TPA: alanine dehydrogenase [Candidatus Tectomicrobia bacterium]|nr:alanine dehydrogenase [Candidatus Tectomicrobia bacterium]
MIIGVPREIKPDEHRVSVVPAGAYSLVKAGHQVFIERGAGLGSGIPDAEYRNVGAQIVVDRGELFVQADMIMKVKEPLAPEYPLLRDGQILFTFLHLAALPELTQVLLARHITAIAYETVQLSDRSLPLLAPMSEVAGRMSVQEGAKYLERHEGGRGVLLAGVPGVPPGQVTIVGGGTVGSNAAKMAVGLGAAVTVIDVNSARLRYVDDLFQGRVRTLMSSEYAIADMTARSDLVIGAALVPGARAPRLVTHEMIAEMVKGTVVVDVAIDQGGCVETSHPTSHSHPTFCVDGVVHYCVANMPGAVSRTSTFALTNVTFPYAMAIANKGWRQAVRDDAALARGLNLCDGHVTHPAVAGALSLAYVAVERIIG